MSQEPTFRPLVLCCLLLMLLLPPAQAQDFSVDSLDLSGLSNTEFLPVKEAYQPDAWFDGPDLVIQWNIAEDYYLYKDRTFFSGSDFNGSDLQYDQAVFEQGQLVQDEFFQKEMVVYRNTTEMRLTNFTGLGVITIEAQGCADAGLCYPPTDFWFEVNSDSQSAIYSEQMPVSLASAAPQSAAIGESIGSPAAISSLLLALIMAFAGGLILNLMPCVFPVLAIKALKISSASEDLKSRAKEAGAYTAGILATVLIIAVTLIAFRAGGAQVGWGFQLQSPSIVLALTTLFFLTGLGFSGFIEFGARFAGTGQSLTEEGKPLQSFFTGVLAMVVASPCSAPFMAAALGYAISQPTAISLLVFSSLGLGMAAPMILLYLIPGFATLLPRPGVWMVNLKEFLAFPMYLTCIWLLWVLIAQVGAMGAALSMAALCMLAMSIWIYGKTSAAKGKTFAAASLIAALFLAFTAVQQQNIKPTGAAFSLEALDAQVGGTQPVFLDVTADWCITCKFNESTVIYSAEIQQLFEDQNVVYMIADWTNENPEISMLLDRYQRVGIPLYLYFAPGESRPKILPQVLTKEMLRELFT